MDIYAEVTARIIDQLEQGVIPWEKPWIACGKAVSHATGKAYSLLNQMLLGRSGEYLTFKQVQAVGGKVKKGEKASMVVFWTWLEREDEDTGEKVEVPFLKYYNVFHIDQCEGVKAKYMEPLPMTSDPNENAESFIEEYLWRSGVKLIHEGDRAYYEPLRDRVVLPRMEQFRETAEYYSTAFHELIHSTGHESRLNRLEKTAFFGSESYSKEELIAEIGAAVLVNYVGLETDSSFRNSAAYLQNWLNVLKGDKRFIVSAAGKAEKAVKHFLNHA